MILTVPILLKCVIVLVTFIAGPISTTSAFEMKLRQLDNDSTKSSDSTKETAAVIKKNADFDWQLMAREGFPKIAFDESEQGEVRFKYDYDGTLSDNKSLSTTLYQADCVTPVDAKALSFTSTIDTSRNELMVDVNVIQETISKSVHYAPIDDISAAIDFCVRVDYNYIDNEGLVTSVNFHETKVTIDVDLTADFRLTEIALVREGADEETAKANLDYLVEAYICLEDNSEVSDPSPLTQGSALQVCVRLSDSNGKIANVYVEDILTFVVSQPEGPGTDSEVITDHDTDPLTAKFCGLGDGICNVKTQLSSKYFVETNPNDLRVDGVAVLAFGTPPGKKKNVPLRGLLKKDSNVQAAFDAANAELPRLLQEQVEGAEFGLNVGLAGSDSSEQVGKMIGIAAAIIFFCSSIVACFYLRRRVHQARQSEKKNVTGEATEIIPENDAA